MVEQRSLITVDDANIWNFLEGETVASLKIDHSSLVAAYNVLSEWITKVSNVNDHLKLREVATDLALAADIAEHFVEIKTNVPS